MFSTHSSVMACIKKMNCYRNKLWKRTLLVVLLWPIASLGFAATKAGIAFEEIIQDHTQENASQKLVLNGMGVRTKLLFKVYVAALYLPEKEKSTDAEKILASDSPKLLKLHFLRGVDAAKIQEAWTDGFAKNCVFDCATSTALVKELGTLMRDMKESDQLEFAFSTNRVQVRINGAEIGAVEGNQFGRNILAIFIGRSPPNTDLKEGLLGK